MSSPNQTTDSDIEKSYALETWCQLEPLSSEQLDSFKKIFEGTTRKPEIDPRAQMRRQIYEEFGSPFSPEDAWDIESLGTDTEKFTLTQEEKDCLGPDACKELGLE